MPSKTGTKVQINIHNGNTPNRVKATKTFRNMKIYTTREINKNFKIKVFGVIDGKKVNTLVGVSGLLRIIGDSELMGRLVDRAFRCMDDKCVCKLRRGVKVTFYVF